MRRRVEVVHPEFADIWSAEAAADPAHGYQVALMDLAGAIAEELRRQGVSQAELARRAGLKAPYVSRVLNNPENITFRTAFRLCNALGLNLDIRAAAPQPIPDSGRRETVQAPRGATQVSATSV
jgi:DNA-binding phage protein